MTDLVIHIGLSKCGSTSIQRYLLGNPNYLGRGGDPARYGNQLTSDFLRLSPINRLPSFGSLGRWSRKAYTHAADICSGPPGTCVLSSEVLSKPKDSSYEPLFDFLERLDKKIWHWGNVKIIVAIRAQGPRIASMYVQNSGTYTNPGQAHFESFVEQCLKREASLHYFSLIDGLVARLGTANVLPLLLEEIAQPQFWAELRNFAGCQHLDNSHTGSGRERSNKRSAAKRNWRVSDPTDPSISRSFANSVLTWIWPQRLFPGPRLLTRNVVADADSRLRKLRFNGETNRAEMIELTQPLDEMIKVHYLEGNHRLQQLLSKDLEGLGYF